MDYHGMLVRGDFFGTTFLGENNYTGQALDVATHRLGLSCGVEKVLNVGSLNNLSPKTLLSTPSEYCQLSWVRTLPFLRWSFGSFLAIT